MRFLHRRLSLRGLQLLLLLLYLLSLLLFYGLYRSDVHTYEQRKLDNTAKQFNGVLYMYEKIATHIYEHVVNHEHITALLHRAAHSKEDERNRIRKELYALLQNDYDKITKQGIRQFHFHLPDNTSFLRFHRPQRYGDNLTQIRESVRLSNALQKRVTGFEEGKIFNGFRYVFPVFYKEMHAGSVEVSISFWSVLQMMQKLYGVDGSFFILKQTVRSKVFDNERTGNYIQSFAFSDFYKERRQLQRIEHKLQDSYIDRINRTLAASYAEHIKAFLPVGHTVSIDGKDLFAAMLPVTNIQNKQVGYAIFYSDKTITSSFFKDLIINLLGLSAFFATLYGIVLFLNKEQKHLQQSLKQERRIRQKEQLHLIEQSKTAALGEMFGVIAHQWKQPLNTQSMLASELELLLAESPVDTKALMQVQKNLLRQIRFMSETVDDFQAFITPEHKRRTFNIKTPIMQILRIIEKPLENERITLKQHLSDEFFVNGVPSELKHVILNLLNNAKEVLTKQKSEHKAIGISLSREGDYGYITVWDNGGGIDPKLLPDNLFEVQVTTKPTGSGIGLSLARVIIQEHMHGYIKAYNDGDKAVFSIKLPLVKEA